MKRFFTILIVYLVILIPVLLLADNIDSTYKYSWGENIGWMNWKPSYGGSDYGVTVSNTELTGYIWAENIGWISLNCSNTDSCSTVDYKVSNDGEGNLSGYAWAENIGWIKFDHSYDSVVINTSGEFEGYAWAENIGWINMNCLNSSSCGTVDFSVQTTWTSSDPVYTLSSSTLSIQNNLVIGDGTRGLIVTAFENYPVIEVDGNFSIATSTEFIASATSSFSIAGNWSNLGTFTHSSGTVAFVDNLKTSIISGVNTFYNFTSSAVGKTLKFAASIVQTFAGTFTITGSSGNLIAIESDTPDSQWLANFLNFQGTHQSPVVTFANIKDSGCYTGPPSSEPVYLDSTSEDGGNVNYSCWVWPLADVIDISGYVYANDKTTTSTDGLIIHLAINSQSIATTTASTSTGQYVFEGVSQPSTSTPITVFIDDTSSGATITRYLGNGNISNLDIYIDHVSLGHDDSGPITNQDISHYTTSTPYTVSTGPSYILEVDTNHTLLVLNTYTYQPGGNIFADYLTIDGTLTLQTYTLTIEGSDTPFVVNGTFNPGASTVSFEGTSTTTIPSATYYNLQTNPETGTPTYVLASTTTTTNDLSIKTSSNASSVLDAYTNNVSIYVGNNLLIEQSQTFDASDSLVVSGNFTNQGTFTHNSGTVEFNATTTGKTIEGGGFPFWNLVFDGVGGEWLYQDGSSTSPNSTVVKNGQATFINAKTGETTVNGGTLLVDWYLGVHVVDKYNTSYNISSATTTISATSTADLVVWKMSSGEWVTGTSQWSLTDASGTIPQPNDNGAIRIREYEKDNSTTTYYKYNLEVDAKDGFISYNYFDVREGVLGAGNGKYIASVSSTDPNVDATISDTWHRSNISQMNSPYSEVNNPPSNGSWFAGMDSYLSFAIDNPTVNIGDLDELNIWTNTGQSVLSVTTTYYGGYYIKAHASDDQGRLWHENTTDYIIRWPYSNAEPSLWSGTCDTNSECGFGHSVSGSGAPAQFEGGTKYSGFATTTSGDIVASKNEAVPSGENTTIIYRVSVPKMSLPGLYQATIFYIASVNY